MPNESSTTDAADAALHERACATHTVPEQVGDVRLDEYAFEVFELIASRRGAHKAAKRGELLVDGAPAQPHWRPRPGQRLELLAPDRAPPPVYHFALRIVLEDEWLAVIEKPAGIPVSGNYARTIERALSANLTPTTRPDALPWPRPVHRLDSPTGGLLLCAKTASAMVDLGRQFQSRSVRKQYRAVVSGRLDGHGRVRIPVDGREAETVFRVAETTRALRTEWISTVDVWPRTGRTHQIRRHLAALGHAVVGDRKYGTPGLVLKGKGLFLWAVRLRFRHPADGRRIDCTLAEPAKFAALRARETRRWAKFRT